MSTAVVPQCDMLLHALSAPAPTPCALVYDCCCLAQSSRLTLKMTKDDEEENVDLE